MRFEWDPAKNQANKRKHRVGFELAQHVFEDPDGQEIINGTDEEYGEERWVAIGRPDLNRTLVLSVIFTPRHPDILRIISARKADPEDEQHSFQSRSTP